MTQPKLTYYGTVKDGRLKLSDRKRYDNEIKHFEGKRIEISVQRARKGRSNEQNAYYWGVVLPCALRGMEDAGNIGLTVDDVHEFFKRRFLTAGKEITIPGTGEVVTVNKTTTLLTTTEMMQYIEQIAQFCAEYLNTIIPQPMTIFE